MQRDVMLWHDGNASFSNASATSSSGHLCNCLGCCKACGTCSTAPWHSVAYCEMKQRHERELAALYERERLAA